MKTQDPQQLSNKIAEKAADAWQSSHGSGDVAIPLSVIAALSMLHPQGEEEKRYAAQALLNSNANDLVSLIAFQWKVLYISRSDLWTRLIPLAQPWDEHKSLPDQTMIGVSRVVSAVVKAGILDLNNPADQRDSDLLGESLMALRSQSALQARGQFLTPASLTDLIARMQSVEEGEWLLEPAAGTGGMFRGVAKDMRSRGLDPTKVHWEAVDIDPIAVSCLAVNSVLWGLGTNVLFGVGNTLSQEDWRLQALDDRARGIAAFQHDLRLAKMLNLLTSMASSSTEVQATPATGSRNPLSDDLLAQADDFTAELDLFGNEVPQVLPKSGRRVRDTYERKVRRSIPTPSQDMLDIGVEPPGL